MPLDEELLEAVMQAERGIQRNANTVSGRFAFWTLMIVLGFLAFVVLRVLVGF